MLMSTFVRYFYSSSCHAVYKFTDICLFDDHQTQPIKR